MKSIKYLLILISSQSFGQIQIPQYSESASLTQLVGYTNFEIEYERPKTNDRKIYGGLVPYDKVWRTGSSYCTKISFDTEIFIDNKKIAKGKYSLYTIPNKDEWTIILNQDTTLYGTHGYDPAKDIIRFSSKPKITNHWAEAFSITMDVVNDKVRVDLHWGEVLVSFELDTRTYSKFKVQALDILENDYELEEDTYANAADYLIHNKSGFGDEYLTLAERLVDKALTKENKGHYTYFIKLRILKLKKEPNEYIKIANDFIEFLQDKKPYDGYEETVEELKKEISKS